MVWKACNSVHLRRVWIAVLLILGWTQEAVACSCAGRPSPAKQFSQAELVFVGEVVDIDDRYHLFRRLWTWVNAMFGREPSYDDYERDFGFEVTFQVEQMWRGPATRTVRVVTGRGGGDCGVEFERGTRYLVYGHPGSGKEWSTNICTRTGELSMRPEDAAFLTTQKLVALP